jgi:hypothetical protein
MLILIVYHLEPLVGVYKTEEEAIDGPDGRNQIFLEASKEWTTT